jgi:DNA-binding transcriptional regulator YiaG
MKIKLKKPRPPARKLSDLPINELRAILRATEASAGLNSTSARIIRRELQCKEEASRGRPPKTSLRPVSPTGLAIAAARKSAGLTQRALAIAIGVDSMQVSRWERGACTPPPAQIQVVAECCGATISIVYGHTETPA